MLSRVAAGSIKNVIRGSEALEPIAAGIGKIEGLYFNNFDNISKGRKESTLTSIVTDQINSREKVLPKVKTYEQARNKALEIVGDLGHDSKPYIGRLKMGAGKIVGRQSSDLKVRWRLDYDPKKGMHINIENFRNGKGALGEKIVIHLRELKNYLNRY